MKGSTRSGDEMPKNHELLEPIQGVLEILNRSSMTGTHKLGLLLVLLDLAPESIGGDQQISLNRLTSRYLDIHWEHGRPYANIVLRQTFSRKMRTDGSLADDATVMQEVRRLRDYLVRMRRGDIQDKPLELVRFRLEQIEQDQEWKATLHESLEKIGNDLWRHPIKLLQHLPGKPRPFLYEPATRKGGIRFLNDVPERLTRFSGILRPLVEFRFAERVAKINKLDMHSPLQGIHTHLFGRVRIMPPDAMKKEMARLQDGKCIFTGELLEGSALSLDHVIPWSRHRLSQVENFVMTTKSVNYGKSDSLVGPDIVQRWLCHILHNSEALRDVAQRFNWPTNLIHVVHVAKQMYEAAVPGTGVWHGDRGVQLLGGDGQQRVKEMLERALSSQEYRILGRSDCV